MFYKKKRTKNFRFLFVVFFLFFFVSCFFTFEPNQRGIHFEFRFGKETKKKEEKFIIKIEDKRTNYNNSIMLSEECTISYSRLNNFPLFSFFPRFIYFFFPFFPLNVFYLKIELTSNLYRASFFKKKRKEKKKVK